MRDDVIDSSSERSDDSYEVTESGDPVCWAHLLCPDCGVVIDVDPHASSCPRGSEGAALGV